MQRRKIILFEGDQSYAKILKETLTIEGFDVLCVDHIPEKVEDRVYEEQPECITIDAILPEMDGFHLAFALKSDLRIRDIPIVFLSSLTHPTDIQHGREVGAADYIVKSKNTPRDIADRIKAVLGQPAMKSIPRAKIARLPDIPSVPQPPRTQSPLPYARALLLAAGIVLLVIAATQLSKLFTPKPQEVAAEIPIEYVEPTACTTDNDCVIQTDCCSAIAVNLYHKEQPKEKTCPAVLCENINVGVACIERHCAVVVAKEQTRGRVVYAAHEPDEVIRKVEEYDCSRRAGEYQSCVIACADDTVDCSAPTCSAECILPNDFLPSPPNRL